MQFPSIPPWDAIHPLLIHFPIALLLLAPLFIVISAILPAPRNGPYRMVATLILVLGTGSLFAAVSSGEEAAELAERGGPVDAVLQAHQHLAIRTEILFSTLSLIFITILLRQWLTRKPETRLISTVVPLASLVLYAVGVVFLVNTAHAGGLLVHEFGVHAVLPQTDQHTAAQPEKPSGTQESED